MNYFKKYGFICLSIFLFLILIIVISYAKDLSRDYNDLQNQFIKEKQNYVFLGDSITNGYQLDEFYDKYYVVNSGVDGNRTSDILNDLDNRVYRYNPTKVFLLIGINDMAGGIDNKIISSNIKKIVKQIKKNRPYTKIYIESVYPLSERPSDTNFRKISNKKIILLNKKIKKICRENNLTYIDVYNELTDEKGNLKEKYTEDGLHLNGLGYYRVTKLLKKYIKEKV